MRTELRLETSGLVSASDASESMGAVCRGIALRPLGIRAAFSARQARASRLRDEGLLISLFDGIGGARRA